MGCAPAAVGPRDGEPFSSPVPAHAAGISAAVTSTCVDRRRAGSAGGCDR
ncbi:hypothetical protein ISF6_1971 [Piscinibacter sakaiensis]|uniref:Uncharacterized protein n=1 Tax=Piscinibacter sakaiensis TaxID=1547922 RepID=A0A0K8P0G9_PISS1|nr:hypothetical protein ISF6_1971 [Piscinibacter sakaiensis]